jgi:hypothetical protein
MPATLFSNHWRRENQMKSINADWDYGKCRRQQSSNQ